MSTRRAMGFLAAVLLPLGWSSAFAQHAHDAKPQDDKPAVGAAMCPVMDEPVDFGVRSVSDDGAVYFCCPKCIAKYEKDKAKYADKVAAQRAALAKLPRVQVTCPVGGEPVSKDAFVETDGQKVYFCCDKCKPKYTAEPAKYAAKLDAAWCYQTKCPVSGMAISADAFEDLATGQRIYFCCKDCPAKFTADPAKFADKLAQQGVHVDPAKLKGGKTEPKKP
ncbi:MAG: hypothetical protein HRF50_00720 [Phycisphaerae bacterium]